MKKVKMVNVVIIVIFFLAFFNSTSVFATDFWGQATSWFNQGTITDISSMSGVKDIFTQVSGMINVIGTSVIIIVTITLGVKYVYGSVDSKSDIKESLITLLVACVFFFGWTGISDLLMPGNKFALIKSTDTAYTSIVGRIFGIGTYVLQLVSVIAIIYVGVRYIFAGASGKADLKGKSVQFLIGIIMIFATTNFLSYISKVINEVF